MSLSHSELVDVVSGYGKIHLRDSKIKQNVAMVLINNIVKNISTLQKESLDTFTIDYAPYDRVCGNAIVKTAVGFITSTKMEDYDVNTGRFALIKNNQIIKCDNCKFKLNDKFKDGSVLSLL